MAQESQYYDCDNANEHIIFPHRKSFVLKGNVLGYKSEVLLIPEANITPVECGDQEHIMQLIRQCFFLDTNGNTNIRLIKGF